MSAKHEITDGPFAGTSLDTSRLQPWRYSNGDPVVINGKEMSEWTPDYLTPIFLRAFDPQLGWSVVTDMVVLEGLKLPDYGNPMVENGVTVKNSFGGDVPTMLQVIKVTATLTDPQGMIVHSACILQGIHNINSADLGVKRALLQLYRGTGLPSSPEGHAPVVVHQKPVEAAQPTRVAPVSQSGSQTVAAPAKLQVRPISQAASQAEGDDLDTGSTEDVSTPVTEADIGQAASQDVSSTDETVEMESDETTTTAQQSNPAPIVSEVDNSKIDPRILNQVVHYAKLAGVEVGQLHDDTAAKAELVRLRRLANGKA